jgi:hypothetical protein
MNTLRKLFGLTLLLVFSMAAAAQSEKLPAFPGAEGFGRYVTGGRGGSVYHVTNLNDSGTGSLRWALTQSGTKTIVFDVSGTIHLQSALNIGSNTTIAGQTAPGDGICVADYPCAIKGNNVIVRYMRFRLGNKNVTKDGADGWDGFGGFDQKDWMIDHCSVSWSIDECLSVLGNKNTTVQWCLVAQSLVNSGHSKGAHGYGGNWGGSGASFHHNLIAHHGSRTPRLGPRPTTQLDERMDYRNNVIYNFGGNGCYGGEGMKVNIVNNYYKPGPGSPTGAKGMRIAGIGIRTNEYVTTYPAYAPALHLWGKYYVTGNVNSQYSQVTNDNWTYGMYNQIDASGCDGTYTAATRDSIKIDQPIDFILTTTHTAQKAYEKVLDYAGASLHRDTFDEMIVGDTRNGLASHTGSELSRGFVNSQDDNKPSGAGDDWSAWPTLNSTAAPADTDNDGMPDEWEDAHGLDKNNASDGNLSGDGGYTNLEVYLNTLVREITADQNADGEQQGNIENKQISGDSDEEGKTTVATGSVNWPMTTGKEGQSAEYDDDVRPYLGVNSIETGSTLTYAGTQKLTDGTTITKFQPSINNEATANDNNAVSFTFSIADKYYFRPTKIEIKSVRCGTDGGAIDISWKNSLGTTSLETMLTPERNNNFTTSAYTDILSDVASTSGSCSLVVNIYKLGNTKQIGLGGIIITGDMKQDAASGIEEQKVITFDDAATYTLQGVRVDKPSKGIYIQNGKKIIIK